MHAGAWGTCTSGNLTAAWTVLDHNSYFAIASVPEPSGYAIGIAVLLEAIVLVRRRPLSRA